MLVIKRGVHPNDSCVFPWKSRVEDLVTIEKRKKLCKLKGAEALPGFSKLVFDQKHSVTYFQATLGSSYA
jgi:hypothetical protein